MGILSVLISVAFLIYLILRISRMLGGDRTEIRIQNEHYDARPKLPDRTSDEVARLLARMPTKWVTYNGATPPLKLKIRGLTEELYRRFSRAHLDAYGQHLLEPLPMSQKMELINTFLPDINSRAYVLDWEGAQYPNGEPLPFTPERLALLMKKDEILRVFITEESGQLAEDNGLN